MDTFTFNLSKMNKKISADFTYPKMNNFEKKNNVADGLLSNNAVVYAKDMLNKLMALLSILRKSTSAVISG